MHDDLGFRNCIWKLRTPYLWIASISIPLGFIMFKMQYPYPNFRGDSASYIAAAYLHADAAEWPVGYSKFLSLIHIFSHSDSVTVSIQYLLLELSALLFIYSLRYLMKSSKITFSILFAFVVFNPLFLHLGNYIMSDALFISLSLLWITQLIWIIYRPSAVQIISHALLLLLLFTVRYNALFYPLISSISLILSPMRRRLKILGITTSIVFVGLFICYTESKFKELTGVRQFSPFSGWQLANNALYMYREIQLPSSDRVPTRFHELDSVIRHSFMSARKENVILNPFIKDYYIWDPSSPLMQYLKYKWKGDTTTNMFTKWASMGPIFSTYGSYLIREHPFKYLKYFVSPNIQNFFFPYIADLGYYNQGSIRIDPRIAKWFDYRTLEMTNVPGNFELSIIHPYPIFMAITNFLFLLSIFLSLKFNNFSTSNKFFNYAILVISSFWLFNFIFSISASSIEIRYQVFQLIINFSFSILLIELFIKSSHRQKNKLQGTPTS